jgi:predicted transcriptional regulator
MSELVKLLQEHRDILNVSGLEKKAGLPSKAISHVINAMPYRKLDADQQRSVVKVLRSLAKDINKNFAG